MKLKKKRTKLILQDDIFKIKEGDNFYTRRQSKNMSDKEFLKKDIVFPLIKRNKLRPKRVAEIGSCDGFRLAAIHKEFKSECVGFEPSVKAIQTGRKKYPFIRFKRSLASRLIFQDAYFDLVIVSFVLHWIDRRTLLQSVAEIDRILIDKGVLVLSDFFVPYPQRRFYHHLPENNVWTYKQNYWEIFLATNLYELVDFCTNMDLYINNQDDVLRFACLLKKDIRSLYKVE